MGGHINGRSIGNSGLDEGVGSAQGRMGSTVRPLGGHINNEGEGPGGTGGGGGRGDYFETLQEQNESRHGVPSVVAPRTREVMMDEMSVMSEISMDPSIMTTHPTRHIEKEESLGKIAEEPEPRSGIDSTTSQSNDQDLNSSIGNLSNTRSNSGSQYSRTHSNGSTNQQSRVGSVTVGAGAGYNRLLERKLAGDRNERKPSAAKAGATRNNVQAAPPTDTGHVHFQDENVMTAREAQAARGAEREAHTAACTTAHVRSSSEVHNVSPPMGQTGHVRSRTHGDAEHDYSAMRTPSNEESTERSNSGGKMRTDNLDSSRKSAVTPGVQPLTGDYVTIFDRKIREMGGDSASTKSKSRDDNKQKSDGHHLPGATDDAMSESEARFMISDCSCCSELMDVLKRNSSATVQLMTLPKLRECLLVAHLHSVSMDTPGRTNIAFPNSGWTKVLMMVNSKHSSNAIVQAELFHTLWSIVTLNPRYTSDLTSNPDMKQIITTMETHIQDEPIQEYGCGLISCIVSSHKHALRLLKMCEGKCIHRLMAALYFDSSRGNVQENSLKALFRLSSASLSSDNPADLFANKMGRYVEDNTDVADKLVNAFDAVLNAMGRYQTNISVQVHGNRLLWNIFYPDAIQDPDQVELLIGKTLRHIGDVMTSPLNSQAFHETIICLLSKMSCFVRDSRGQEALLSAVAVTMKTYSNSGTVALHGCRCLAHVCAMSPTLSLSRPVVDDGIPAIISCMEAFQEHITVQSECCAALSAICIKSPLNKERVCELGGIGRINHAYDCYSMTRYEDHCVTTKIRACIALTTLAVDPVLLSDIRGKGIITKFERLVEEDSDIPATLLSTIRDLLTLASDADNLYQNLEFREGSSEDETIGCLRANLRLVTTPAFTRIRIVPLISKTVKAMQRFATSTSVHENACKLLACLFALASEGEPTTAQGGEIVSEQLETIADSLSQHKNDPTNAAAACSALQNFLVMQSLSRSSDALGLFLNTLLSRSVTNVINCLVIHQEDEQNLEQGTGALQALFAMREGLVLSFENDSTIGLMIGAMVRFPNSKQLRRHCIGILGTLFSVSNRIMDFLNDELLNVIVRFLEQEIDNQDAFDLVDSALNIILVMTSKGYQAATILLRNEKLLDTVVCCMWKFPSHLSIQSSGTAILSSTALDNYLRADVCQRGGTSRIINALDKLKHDPVFVCTAFSALANLTSGADIEILRARDSPAPEIFVRAMTTHPENLSVQVNGAHAIWALSARSDSFKDEIVNLGGAEAVAAAMELFAGSRQMQGKGFVVMWSCSVPRHLKMRVGRCAIEPVVNGLAAHIASEKICEEALGCLKCLSTLAENKDLLEENDAADLIYSCMWLHSGNSSVCKAALAALCNISVNVDTNEVAEITSEDLDAIVHIMRTHQSVKAVQESAIILLRNFTFSRTNVIVLEQNPFLTALVRSAMSTFNDHFHGRADDLLRVLPAFNQ
ncbi:hypothetical protein ACHAXR_013251 [Thalassiosira sp. AJA248-18]